MDLSKVKGFDWDSGNLEHIKKHNVAAKECEDVFFNKPRLLSKDEVHSKIEERSKTLGITSQGRLIFVAFTIRNNRIRIVSARDQNRKEREKLKVVGGESV